MNGLVRARVVSFQIGGGGAYRVHALNLIDPNPCKQCGGGVVGIDKSAS